MDYRALLKKVIAQTLDEEGVPIVPCGFPSKEFSLEETQEIESLEREVQNDNLAKYRD